MRNRGNGRRSKTPLVAADVIAAHTTLRAGLISVTGTKEAFAFEVPFTLTNLTTTADIKAWDTCKRFQFSGIKVELDLADIISTSTAGQYFIGWNKTPLTGAPTSVDTAGGYRLYMDKCDRKVISRNSQTVGLSMGVSSTGWKQYFSAAVYSDNKLLLDREVKEFCHGSLVFGWCGTIIDRKKFVDNLRIDCLQQLQIAKPSASNYNITETPYTVYPHTSSVDFGTPIYSS